MMVRGERMRMLRLLLRGQETSKRHNQRRGTVRLYKMAVQGSGCEVRVCGVSVWVVGRRKWKKSTTGDDRRTW